MSRRNPIELDCPECGSTRWATKQTECKQCGAHLRLKWEVVASAIGED